MTEKKSPIITAADRIAAKAEPLKPGRKVALASPPASPPYAIECHACGATVMSDQPPPAGVDDGRSPTKTDSVARGRAQAIIEQIVNPALDAARRNFEIAQTSGSRPALSNWEAAMTESMIELRELQDAVDAIDARMKEIRATIAQGLDHSDEKTFKFALGKVYEGTGKLDEAGQAIKALLLDLYPPRDLA